MQNIKLLFISCSISLLLYFFLSKYGYYFSHSNPIFLMIFSPGLGFVWLFKKKNDAFIFILYNLINIIYYWVVIKIISILVK